MPGKDHPEQRRELAALVERQRRELAERPDVSLRMRQLSASGTKQPVPHAPAVHRSLRTTIIAIGTGLVVSLLAVILIIVVVTRIFFQSQIGSPAQVAQQYYTALHEGDIPRAYSYFSPATRATLSESAFTTQEQGFEQIEGIVETYTTLSTTTTGNTAVIHEQVRRRSSDHAETDTLNMVQEDGNWYIASIVIPASK